MDWKVRRASTEDIKRLSLVGSATFLETFAGVLDGDAIVSHCQREHSASAYFRYLSSGCRAWLAESDIGRAPVGFSLIGPAALPGSASDGTDIELKRIYVLSRLHGRGVAAALMNQAADEAYRVDAKRLLLGVYKDNARAISFYRKNGFEKLAERRFRVGDREYDDVVLAKPLNGAS